MAVTQSGVAGPVIFGAAADAITGQQCVKFVSWIGVTTAGHILHMKDTAGNTKFKWKAQAANDPVFIPIFDIWNGIVATTMQSGEVHVYRE